MAIISDYLRAGFDGDVESSAPPRAPLKRTQKRIAKAALSKRSEKRIAKAALNAAKAAAPVASRFGGVPGFLAGTVLSAAAFPLIERLVYGSREDQMREQFETQRKLEEEQAAKMGGMGGVPGGPMMAGDDRSMQQLLQEEQDSLADLGYASSRNRALGALGSPSGTNELESLLAGQEARIRSIQAPRQLTPYEIMGILNG